MAALYHMEGTDVRINDFPEQSTQLRSRQFLYLGSKEQF